MLEMRVSQLLEHLVPLARSATANDLPRLLAQIERVKRMQVLAAGGSVPPVLAAGGSVPPVQEAGSLGIFGPSPAGDNR
jgi:hypothetical protein